MHSFSAYSSVTHRVACPANPSPQPTKMRLQLPQLPQLPLPMLR
jgi:hypothetical protein